MNPLLKLSRRARWAVPAGVVAVTAGVTAGSMISVAQAAPELPARSAAQLLAAVSAAGHASPPPLTGTVVETAALGVPDLPGTGNPSSITSLLAGSHTIRVWYADPTHIRLAIPVTLSETDVIRNGSTVWVWQSQSNTVNRMSLPAKASRAAAQAIPTQVPVTPQQAAQQVLAAVGPSTAVSVDPAVTVAGQAAYELVLAPKDTSSLVGRVTIALDGQHSDVPLRVQVFARGASTPAFQVGFTSVAFVQPAAANFTFTPPARAKVITGSAGIIGPAGLVGGAGLHVSKNASPQVRVRQKVAKGQQRVQIPLIKGHAAATGQPTVIGQDWMSVAVLPAGALAGVSGAGGAASVAGQAAQGVAGGPATGPAAGQDLAILGALLNSATPVHGAWGSGRLLHTSLVSILMLDNGKVLIGAVAPSVLYADVAQVK